MDSAELPDWLILDVDEALAAIADADDRAQAVGRVVTQYVPAAMRTSGAAATERVWDALFRYFTARPAPRKRWSLGEAQAMELVARVRDAAARLREELPG